MFETGLTCTPTGGCFTNVCGDGIAGNGEACDDGNAINDDACSDACTLNGATCASPAVLTADAANTFSVQSNTTGVSTDYDIDCGVSGNNGDLFYQFTAPVAGLWTFSVTGESTFDTALAVTTTCGDNTTEIACVEDTSDGVTETLEVELEANDTVFIVVDGWGSSTSNEGQFTLVGSVGPLRYLGDSCDPSGAGGRCASGLTCDPGTLTCETMFGALCAAPIVLSATDGSGFDFSGTTVGFGRNYEVDCDVSSNNPDVFHEFTAPVAGTWHFTVTGDSNFDTALAVTSACGDPSTEVACVEATG
jgi:cysteine-rich repeat protein